MAKLNEQKAINFHREKMPSASSKINERGHNQMKHPDDADKDGKKDCRAHEELSEDPNRGVK